MFVHLGRSVLVLALAGGVAHAQEPPMPAAPSAVAAPAAPEAPPLSLGAAISTAVARHPDLNAIAQAAAAARARGPVERELMPPMLEAQAWQWPLDKWNPGDAQWMVMLTQEFPGRGKRALRAARMEAEAEVMAAEAPVKRREIAAEVARAYVELRGAREERDALAEARDVVRQGVDAAEIRYTAGRGAQSDVLAGIVELSRLQEEEVMAAERARMAASQLNVLLGRDPDAPIGPLDTAAPEAPVPALKDIETQVLATHPEQAVVDRRVSLAEAEEAVARSEARPDFLVQGGYMVMPSMTDAITARAGITWPNAPWAKKRTTAMVAAAQAAAAAAAAQRDAIAQRLRLMAQEAIVRADAAQDRARVLETTVLPRAQHALEIARIGYQADRGELMPMIDAQRTLVDTRLRIRRAIADRDRAIAELRALLGEFEAVPSSVPPTGLTLRTTTVPSEARR